MTDRSLFQFYSKFLEKEPNKKQQQNRSFSYKVVGEALLFWNETNKSAMVWLHRLYRWISCDVTHSMRTKIRRKSRRTTKVENKSDHTNGPILLTVICRTQHSRGEDLTPWFRFRLINGHRDIILTVANQSHLKHKPLHTWLIYSRGGLIHLLWVSFCKWIAHIKKHQDNCFTVTLMAFSTNLDSSKNLCASYGQSTLFCFGLSTCFWHTWHTSMAEWEQPNKLEITYNFLWQKRRRKSEGETERHATHTHTHKYKRTNKNHHTHTHTHTHTLTHAKTNKQINTFTKSHLVCVFFIRTLMQWDIKKQLCCSLCYLSRNVHFVQQLAAGRHHFFRIQQVKY